MSHPITVSELCLGSWHTYSRLRFPAILELLRAAHASGIRSYEIARYYDRQDLDVLVGHSLRCAGIDLADVEISAKVSLYSCEFSVKAEVDELCARIGTDRLAAIVAGEHRPDQRSMAEYVEEVGEVIADGRVGSWGVMNWPLPVLREACDHAAAHGVPLPSFVQVKYNVARRALVEEPEFAGFLRERSIGVQAAEPFEGGLFAGRAHPARHIARDPGGIRDRIRETLPDFVEVARSLGVPAAQLALAFSTTGPGVTSVLFGASRPHQIADAVAAVELAARRGDELRSLLDRFEVRSDVFSKDPYVPPALPPSLDPYWLIEA